MKTEYLLSLLIPVLIMVAFPGSVEAQRLSVTSEPDTLSAPEGYMFADSVIVRFVSPVDTALAGKNILSELPLKEKGDNADVRVHQSQDIRMALITQIKKNPERTIDGYRVRIFFDNRQSSRIESEAAEKKFRKLHPDVPVYRNHVNPYFKVTAGDFRTKSEAMQLLRNIVSDFPTSFIVKEKINYPIVDKSRPVVTDTVRILRPVAPEQGNNI